MRTSQHVLVLAVMVAALAARADAATYHVRTNGSDTNCSGLMNAADPGSGAVPRDCAFRSPQKGADTAAGGDTVLIHGGTYTGAGTTVQNVTTMLGLCLRTGLVSEPTRLTIQAAGDGDAVFDGGNTLITGIVIWGTSYVTIRGIEIRHFTANTSNAFTYGAAGVNVGSTAPGPSSHLVLDDLNIHDATASHATGNFSEIAIWCQNCVLRSALPYAPSFSTHIAVGSTRSAASVVTVG